MSLDIRISDLLFSLRAAVEPPPRCSNDPTCRASKVASMTLMAAIQESYATQLERIHPPVTKLELEFTVGPPPLSR